MRKENYTKHFIRAVVLLCVTALIISAQPPVTAAAPVAAPVAQSGNWYDPAWTQRMSVLVTNPGPDVTDYQLHVPLDSRFYFNLAKPDGSDLRVTAADGTTLLPFWIESWTSGVSASVWVRIPSLDSGANTTLYFYIGNPAASAASNGAAVFDLFDGFETTFGRPLINALNTQTTPTYDGSGQSVHPGISYFPSGWNGYEYWLAITPYPDGDPSFENPSILVSHDGLTWSEPLGITNPVALPPEPPDGSYLADGELFYDETSDQLWLYYPHQNVGGDSYMVRKTSDDGVNWGDPRQDDDRIFSVPDFQILSPAVEKIGSQYWMWTVNSGSFGCTAASTQIEYRTSTNGITWTLPGTVNFSQPGYTPWHLDVITVPSKSELWALVAAYPSGTGCDNTDLLFAKSTNGIDWTTYPVQALLPSPGTTWDSAQIYRSTLLYDAANDRLRVWYSASTYQGAPIWHQGYTERNYTQFLAALSTPNGSGWIIQDGNGYWSPAGSPVRRGQYSGQLNQYPGRNMLVSKALPITITNDFYQEWDMYDDMNTTSFKVVRMTAGGNSLGVGVWTGASTGNYVYHSRDYYYIPTSVPRTLGWHKFGILLQADGSATFYIDGQQVGSLAGQFTAASSIRIEGESTAPSSYVVDDIRIRKYSSPEPVTTLAGPNAVSVATLTAQSVSEAGLPANRIALLLAVMAVVMISWRRLRR
jgi:hypothetical protein